MPSKFKTASDSWRIADNFFVHTTQMVATLFINYKWLQLRESEAFGVPSLRAALLMIGNSSAIINALTVVAVVTGSDDFFRTIAPQQGNIVLRDSRQIQRTVARRITCRTGNDYLFRKIAPQQGPRKHRRFSTNSVHSCEKNYLQNCHLCGITSIKSIQVMLL